MNDLKWLCSLVLLPSPATTLLLGGYTQVIWQFNDEDDWLGVNMLRWGWWDWCHRTFQRESWDTRNVLRYLVKKNWHQIWDGIDAGRQVQLQREELLLELAQLAQRARLGRVLHQGQDHLESLDQLSGGVDQHWCQKNNQYDADMVVIRLTKLISGWLSGGCICQSSYMYL